MLDISNNSIQPNEEMANLTSLKKVQIGGWHIGFRNLLLVLLGTFFFFMFLPWTQNVNAEGKLTTLRPEQRPQTIHATIAGRVEAWYVTEGQSVRKGDTIVHISEVKSDYFDPQLVERVGNQVNAKEGAIESYQGKADALGQQMEAMRREMRNKMDQIENKIEQKALKVISDSIAILQAENDVKIAKRQLDGMKAMYDKGLESLTKLEERRLKLVDVETKLVKATNELEISRNELNNAKIENSQESKVSELIRDYLTLINKKIPNKSKVYEEFKARFKKRDVDFYQNTLQTIKQYSVIYNKLLNPSNETVRPSM